jgi:pimeloyl-[acyl-carrier protein] methyl ester esterase
MAETLNISIFPKTELSNFHKKTSLVLIHGWGLNSAVWQPFIDSLPSSFFDTFNIVTIDLPGFGNNINQKIHPYSIANICQYIVNTIKEPAVYLGWSLGGLIATEMAINHPEKVLGLVTIASSPHFLEEKNQKLEENPLVWPGIKAKVLESFYHQLQVDIQKTITNFLKIQAMGSPHIVQDINKISELVFQYDMASKTTLEQSLMLLESSDYRQQLKNITQPFLRLYGDADSLIPKAVIDKVEQLAPTSDSHRFKRASHAPFISHLDDFKLVLTRWLLNRIKDNSVKAN